MSSAGHVVSRPCRQQAMSSVGHVVGEGKDLAVQEKSLGKGTQGQVGRGMLGFWQAACDLRLGITLALRNVGIAALRHYAITYALSLMRVLQAHQNGCMLLCLHSRRQGRLRQGRG